ncbi:phosphatidylglycerophosphatase A [Catenovulum sp. SM1970]|uniref:phosphatidylglycerophosphatase A family protein n=1 Tax=Marinifaba aquimaris TaxID=2741323 RepID=UPI001573DEEA|nr:phosphatidylglycerophosphatase A [Marinifaba aquimaris]NTS77059.1 phosphatidylglycerophosphatase A [Marinifaba aquimaris]
MKIRPELKQLNFLNPIHFLALGFGSGYAPKAPGTFGTLAAIPVVYLASLLPLTGYVALTFIFAVIGCFICGYTANALKTHDHPAIVWDEVVGLMITFIAIPLSWQNLLAGFVLFRFFDILKPWPIKWADQKVHGGTGIMLDDVFAGLMAWLVLLVLIPYIN